MHLLIAFALSTLFAFWDPVPAVFDPFDGGTVQVAAVRTPAAPALVLAQ